MPEEETIVTIDGKPCVLRTKIQDCEIGDVIKREAFSPYLSPKERDAIAEGRDRGDVRVSPPPPGQSSLIRSFRNIEGTDLTQRVS